MNNQKPALKGRALALQQFAGARTNLLLMLALTAINLVLLATGSDYMMLFSATIPYLSVAFGLYNEMTVLLVAGIAIAAVSMIAYLLCWIFSKKHYGWMIAALVLFALDTICLVGFYFYAGDFSGILDLLIHVLVLYYLILGVKSGYQLTYLPEDEVLPDSTLPVEAAETTNQ